jgi:hypothetical protein
MSGAEGRWGASRASIGRPMNRVILIALGLSLTVGVACLSDPEAPGIEITDSRVESLGAAPDSVVLSITFVNSSDEVVIFSGGPGDGGSMDVEVRNAAGEFVWSYLWGKIFAAIFIPYPIQAGQSETWSLAWPVVDTLGVRVAPGTYSVVGILGDDLNVPLRRTTVHQMVIGR